MNLLNQVVGRRLEWRQPSAWSQTHELAADGEVIGSLRFEKRYGSLATAQFGENIWTFKRSGFWSPIVTVREAGREMDAAVFTPKWSGGGELMVVGGRRFTLRSVSFWGGEWAFESEGGDEVVSVHGPRGVVKHHGEASLGLSATRLPETRLLLPLIWYLRLLMIQDAETTAVTLTTAG